MNDFLDRLMPTSEEAKRWIQTLRALHDEIDNVPWPNTQGQSHLDEDRRKAVLFTLMQFRAFANENDIFRTDTIAWSRTLHDYELILIKCGELPDEWYEYPSGPEVPLPPQPLH